MNAGELGGYLEGHVYSCADCGARGSAVSAFDVLFAVARVINATFFENLDGEVVCGACVDAGRPASNVTRIDAEAGHG